LLAIGIDADGRNVILAWAVVESENRNSWEYFLRLLRRCIPEIISERCVFISDRDKGLVKANVLLGENCVRAYCCKHIEGNLKDAYGAKDGLMALFWRAARARLPTAFEHWMDKITACNLAAALYLRAIPADMWASAHFPGTRQGHLTSNIVELVNKLLREDRSLSITDLLDAIWHRVMEARASSLKAAQEQLAAGLR
jgi:transposase-like protein